MYNLLKINKLSVSLYRQNNVLPLPKIERKKMEEVINVRMTTAEKERLREMASEKGMTISQFVLDALKIKRRKRVKPRQDKTDLVQKAA